MALTKVGKEGITGISNSSDATFLTVDSSEQAVIKSEGGAVTTSVQQGLAKFWIAHNGQGTPSAYDSFNVGSITDVGQGNYKYNFTNNFNTAKGYTTMGVMSSSSDHNGSFIKLCMPMNEADVLTSSLEISATYSSSGSTGDFDYEYVNNAGVGDLA